jgi:hypothetical protein
VTTVASIGGVGGHSLLPILVIAVLDDEGDRAAHGATEANPGDRPHFIFLDEHSAAPTVTFLAAR